MTIQHPSLIHLQQVKKKVTTNSKLAYIIQGLQQGLQDYTHYTFHHGLLYHKNRIELAISSQLITPLLEE